MVEIIDDLLGDKDKLIQKGHLFAYVPRHLVVEKREELWVFPLNILFTKFRNESDGFVTMGSALYEPDLSSFATDAEKWTMTYYNKYGRNSHVLMTFEIKDKNYIGQKIVNNQGAGSAFGRIKDDAPEKGWGLFFTHLTMLGLTNGEPCSFKRIDTKDKL